jgi:hypothetical protein
MDFRATDVRFSHTNYYINSKHGWSIISFTAINYTTLVSTVCASPQQEAPLFRSRESLSLNLSLKDDYNHICYLHHVSFFIGLPWGRRWNVPPKVDFDRTKGRYAPKDRYFRSHPCEILKSNMIILTFCLLFYYLKLWAVIILAVQICNKICHVCYCILKDAFWSWLDHGCIELKRTDIANLLEKCACNL